MIYIYMCIHYYYYYYYHYYPVEGLLGKRFATEHHEDGVLLSDQSLSLAIQ